MTKIVEEVTPYYRSLESTNRKDIESAFIRIKQNRVILEQSYQKRCLMMSECKNE